MNDIYCMRCKAKTPNTKLVNKISSNGRHMAQANCAKCGTKKNKFVAGKSGAGVKTVSGSKTSKKVVKKKVVKKKATKKRVLVDIDDSEDETEDINALVEKLLMDVDEGDGLLDIFKNAISAIRGGVRKGPSPKLRAMVKKYGDKMINRIIIQRFPVAGALKMISDLVTKGKFSETQKKLGYDDIYHLSMILAMENNKSLMYQKNEVAVMTDSFKMQGEHIYVDLPEPILLDDFINNTVKAVGIERYYLYSADNFNCQRFILDHLNANNIPAPANLEKFIMQDAAALLQRNPKVISLFRKVTDLGALFNVVKEGEGIYGRGFMDIIKKLLSFFSGGDDIIKLDNNKDYNPGGVQKFKTQIGKAMLNAIPKPR